MILFYLGMAFSIYVILVGVACYNLLDEKSDPIPTMGCYLLSLFWPIIAIVGLLMFFLTREMDE